MSSVFDGAEPDNEFPAFANLPWQTDLTSAVEGAAAGLAADNNLREHLLDWLSRQPRSSMAYILDRSQERPSHYKWCLAGGRDRFYVWLHQYKEPAEYASANRWAASIHNHRYGFASAIISGALHTSWYSAKASDATLQPGSTEVISEGTVYQVLPTTFTQSRQLPTSPLRSSFRVGTSAVRARSLTLLEVVHYRSVHLTKYSPSSSQS